MRVRLTFAKLGPLRYIGHLDLHSIWERTCRRAELPLSYSQGFHPQPKIQLASALPLGFSSRCEMVDIWLNESVETDSMPQRIQNAVPGGLQILKAEDVDERSPALQTMVSAAEYEVTLRDPIDPLELTRNLATVLDAKSIIRIRRKKEYDLRPLIEELREDTPNSEGQPLLLMRLAAREGATGRPEEVLAELGIDFESTFIERTALIMKEA